MMALRVYVGCSLAKAPDPFKKSITTLKQELSKSFDVLEFLGQTKGTDTDVYQHDMSCVANADFVVAICDEPSTGLGVELERARLLQKPVLVVAHTGSQVSRLVLGMAEAEPTMRFMRYENLVPDVPRFAEMFSSQMIQ